MTDAAVTAPRAPKRPAVRRGPAIERNLVIAHQPGWQSLDDWKAVAIRARTVDTTTGIIVVRADHPNEELRERAAQLPSLIFSPGPLGRFQPLRGRVYQGRQIRKFEQLQRLAAAGIRVPRTQILQPDAKQWGEHVIIKPTDIATSSKGNGIQLMRTERVQYIRAPRLPGGAPRTARTHGGAAIYRYRRKDQRLSGTDAVGEPLYCQLSQAQERRVDFAAKDQVLEGGMIAIQGMEDNRQRIFRYEADVVAMPPATHRAVPEIPLKGCDILRDTATGRLHVIELNTNSNTWHFSSSFQAAERATFTPEFISERYEQIYAFGTGGHVLADVTQRKAK